jgi:hypothetical protein
MEPNTPPAIAVLSRPPPNNQLQSQRLFGVLLYLFDQGTKTYLPPMQLAETRAGHRIVSQDLNGNGLNDIAWTEGEVLKILLAREGQNKP